MPTTANAVTSTIRKVTGTATRPPGARGALVVRGGYVITMDPATGDLPSADVLVSDGAIAARARRSPCRRAVASWTHAAW
jgi:hypothetical protein